jgi:spore germination protein KB
VISYWIYYTKKGGDKMLKKINISAYQFTLLVTLYTVGSAILVIPASMAADSKQDAWIASILGVGAGLLLVWLYSTVGNLFPNRTLVELNEILLGKWLGKAISLLFVVFAFLSCSEVMFYLGNFLTLHILQGTPILSIHIAFMIVVIIGVRYGIESIARCVEILFPVFIILFIILALSVSPQIKVENIQPILETGIKPILRSTLVFLSIASLTLIVLLMIFPACVNTSKKARRSFFIGHFTGGFIMIVIITLSIFILGPSQSARNMYPSYELASRVTIGGFLERIEALLAVMWLFSLYIKISLYFYAAVLGLAQMLELKDYRPLTLPIGMIIIVLSVVVYPSVTYQQNWDTTTWLPFILTVGLFYPIFLLGVGIFRKKHQAGLKK